VVIKIVGFTATVLNIIFGVLSQNEEGNALNIFSKNYSRTTQISIGIGGAIICLSTLFKIQDYPGAAILALIGWNTLAISLIIRAFSTPKKKKEEIDISQFGKGQQ
jgi:hypothetical protein